MATLLFSLPGFLHRALRKAACASLLLALCCTAPCAALAAMAPTQNAPTAPQNNQERDISVAEAARLVDPSALRLSPEAEHLYYYLVLSQGLADNSRSIIAQAMKGLLKLDPSLPVFQDSATILLARHEFSAAEAMAKDGLRHFPGDALLTLLLSGAYSESGRIAQAIALLEKYLKKDPDNLENTEELLKLYLRDRQDEKASALLARMPKGELKPESELFRAGVLSSIGRLKEAREILEALIEKQPDNFGAWLELAYIAEEEKNTDAALAAYLKAAEFMPGHQDLWLRICLLYLEQGKPDKALEALNDNVTIPALYMQAALRFTDAKRYTEAEKLVARATELGTNPDEAALLLSMIAQEYAKKPAAALAPLERISKDSPLYAAALEQKTRVYLVFDDYASALKVAEQGRSSFPDRKALWGLEAYTLLKQGKAAESEKLLESALLQYPYDEELLFSLGSVQHEAGKEDAAMATMESIIVLNPGNYQALNYVGYCLADAGKDLERAYTLVAAALDLRPDADFIVDSMAWVQYKMGRYEDAWKSIRHCVSLGGDDAAIWEHYGDIAMALDKKDEAAKAYKQALSKEPNNAQAVKKKLKQLGGGK